jgi:hypothetical protein
MNTRNFKVALLVAGTCQQQQSKPTMFLSFSFQAQDIKQAIWESEWVGAPLEQQRKLMFMMAVADKEFALTAGGFVPLTRHTMLMVSHVNLGPGTGMEEKSCSWHSILILYSDLYDFEIWSLTQY